MRLRSILLASCLLVPAVGTARAAPLTPEAVNGASFVSLSEPAAKGTAAKGTTKESEAEDSETKTPSPEVIRAAVLLDRARFSPGAIDGLDGDNFRKAVKAYQAANGLPATGGLDEATWTKLVGADKGPAIVSRAITAADAKGPFARHIPAKMEAQAKLPRMAYHDLAEKLSEQYHVSPGLLRTLNPHEAFAAGRDIQVPQVVVDRGAPATVARIVVDKADRAVEAYGGDGKLLAFYPASIGSDEKPAPSGSFTVLRVTHNPGYTYNPKYAFKGVHATQPFTIAPGPNNPVGSVWIDLSDPGYGIHGTPEPDRIGKTQSHGCIRMTNWDVEDLASMVGKGVPVDFLEQPDNPAAPPPMASAQPGTASATAAPHPQAPPAAQASPLPAPATPASATPVPAAPASPQPSSPQP